MNDKDFKYSGNCELQRSENALPKYNKYIVQQIKLNINQSSESLSILDFGAGIGTLANMLKSDCDGKIYCFEPDKDQAERCRELGFETFVNIEELHGRSFDLIYSSNVLEHIKDDFETVKNLSLHLKQDGILFTYVPALNFLWTDMDNKVGHYRRYSKKHLKKIIINNQLAIKSSRYVDCVGVLAMLIVKVLGFDSKSGLGNSQSLKFYDNIVWPISKKLDLIFKYLIGKNLLIVAHKK